MEKRKSELEKKKKKKKERRRNYFIIIWIITNQIEREIETLV